MFKTRSQKLEKIDTGDYTQPEYERFLREIAFINRYFGDSRALRQTLFKKIESAKLSDFSVLDVGSGSGELLCFIAKFAQRNGYRANLVGIDLNEISALAAHAASTHFPGITSIRGNALKLPFSDGSFDFVISSLFFHHLKNEEALAVLSEMTRVARRGIIVIDLYRHPLAYLSYKVFCTIFGISPLVRHDGSLSILRGFKTEEFAQLVNESGISDFCIKRHFPFRITLGVNM